jgi:amino acid permease
MRVVGQITFFLGVLLLVVGGSYIAYALRNMTAAFRRGGVDAALHAPDGSIDGAVGLVLVLVGLALLRRTLRGRIARVVVIVLAVAIVVLAVHAGYVA